MNNSFENSKQVSGFLVADNGKEYFVLTEYRVVEKVDRILVTFIDGTTVDAHFQKQDAGTGLAILKIDSFIYSKLQKVEIPNFIKSYMRKLHIENCVNTHFQKSLFCSLKILYHSRANRFQV